MTTEKYNGWTNYETWNAALWIDNDQSMHEHWSEAAQDAFDNSEANDTFSRKENATFALKDQIYESFEEEASESKSYGWMADAINAYLSEVNWHEIAEHFLSDVE